MIIYYPFIFLVLIKLIKKEDGNLAIYYEMESCENQQTRGIVEVDSDSKRLYYNFTI